MRSKAASQKLRRVNDKFVCARAIDFAQRMEKEAGAEPEAQVRLAWRLALGREPSADELKSGTAFTDVQRQQRSAPDPDKAETDSRKLAIADFCQAIFALNEFIYGD